MKPFYSKKYIGGISFFGPGFWVSCFWVLGFWGPHTGPVSWIPVLDYVLFHKNSMFFYF